jgi:hypothetical protein
VVPHCKLIALLRNPVERAISHYFHAMKLHKEYLPLMEALFIEEERIQKIHKSTYPSSALYKHAAYKKRYLRRTDQAVFAVFPKKTAAYY